MFPGYNRLALMNTFYSWTAWMFLLAWPQILLTLFLTTASLLVPKYIRWSKGLRLLLLVLAVGLRFPIPGPLYLWKFIFGFSLHVWGNLPPYLATVAFWMAALGFLVRDWKGQQHHYAEADKYQ